MAFYDDATLEDLDSILEMNYFYWDPNEIERNAVIDYLSNTESVRNEEMLLVKRLNKFSYNLLVKFTKDLDALTERIYQFHLEGTQVCRKRITELEACNHHNNQILPFSKKELTWLNEQFSDNYFGKEKNINSVDSFYLINSLLRNSRRMEAHTHYYASGIAFYMFTKTNQIIWKEREYQHTKSCIEIIDTHLQHPNDQIYLTNRGTLTFAKTTAFELFDLLQYKNPAKAAEYLLEYFKWKTRSNDGNISTVKTIIKFVMKNGEPIIKHRWLELLYQTTLTLNKKKIAELLNTEIGTEYCIKPDKELNFSP